MSLSFLPIVPLSSIFIPVLTLLRVACCTRVHRVQVSAAPVAATAAVDEEAFPALRTLVVLRVLTLLAWEALFIRNHVVDPLKPPKCMCTATLRGVPGTSAAGGSSDEEMGSPGMAIRRGSWGPGTPVSRSGSLLAGSARSLSGAF